MNLEDPKNSAPEAETIETVEMGRGARTQGAGGAGTVRLLDENTVVLIPTPSPDPKGIPYDFLALPHVGLSTKQPLTPIILQTLSIFRRGENS